MTNLASNLQFTWSNFKKKKRKFSANFSQLGDFFNRNFKFLFESQLKGLQYNMPLNPVRSLFVALDFPRYLILPEKN